MQPLSKSPTLLHVDGLHHEICERSSLSSLLALSQVDARSRGYALAYFQKLAQKMGFSEKISYKDYEVSREYTYLKRLVQRLCGLFFTIHNSSEESPNDLVDNAYNLLLNPVELLSYDILTLIDVCMNRVNESRELSYYTAYTLPSIDLSLNYQPTFLELVSLKVLNVYETKLSAIDLKSILLLVKQCNSYYLQNVVLKIFLSHYQKLDVEDRRLMILTSLSFSPFIRAINSARPKSLLFSLIIYLNGVVCSLKEEPFKSLQDILFKLPEELFSPEVSIKQVIDLFASEETINSGYKELTPSKLCEIHSNWEGLEYINQLKLEYKMRNH